MNYSVNLSSGQTVEVVIGEAAQINIEQALNYIESGRVEITKYVNEWAKPEITNYTKEYAEPIVTEIVYQTTKPLIDDYLNTTTKPQIDEYVADNVKPYADSAQDSAAKAKISEDNAKTSEINAKASELAAASSAGVASAAAVTATEAKDYTAKVLTDENLKTVGQDLQSADSNIKTVATNILNVNTVAKNIDNVNLLAPHTEAMEALAPDIMDVVTVAGIAEQTKNVSDNMTAVVDVSNNKTNINNVASNITAVNNVSENMADVKNAVQSANDAKLWAVGTITEKPEGSSKHWAEEAKKAVQTPDATETVKGIVRLATSDEVTAGTNNSAAITPLKFKQKLDTKQDKSTAVNYNNISNCITYIPQDIKLELNNGTLTLKAGSKVYIPNGPSVFDIKNITTDVSTTTTGDGTIFYGLHSNGSLARYNQTFSGSSQPESKDLNVWYDTTNNIVKRYSAVASSWQDGFSLPIAKITISGGQITSIDQVFNGFGYIGSTVYALPGVKGLIPNGRNADGSLKNIEKVITKVAITTNLGSTDTRNITLYNDGNIGHPKLSGYLPDENFFWIKKNDGTGYIKGSMMCVGPVEYSSGKITSFTPKTAFHAVDYNDAVKYSDKAEVIGWGIPDYNAGITLTFNKVITDNGESKTMAKSGLFCFEFLANNVISTIYFYVNNSFVGKIGNSKTSVAFWDEINFPVTKGDVVKVRAETAGGFTAVAVESYLFPYKGSMYE